MNDIDNNIVIEQKPKFTERIRLYDRILWILAVAFFWYLIVGEIVELIFGAIVKNIPGLSASWLFVLGEYATRVGGIIVLYLLCRSAKNRPVWQTFIPSKDGRSWKLLGAGLLIGFLMNFFCIAAAMLHGDVKLIFDFTIKGVPLMLVALLAVGIQCAEEEVWTRGFLYERINVHYPLWVAIVINGALFGAIHLGNPGITALALVDLVACGISYSLLKWYTGSIWVTIGVHTMWNYTQNLIFGLPNSGLVSETSIFHADAINAVSNWAYDYKFGVEGAVPGVILDVLLGALCLYLGWRAGRLPELLLSKEKKAELGQQSNL